MVSVFFLFFQNFFFFQKFNFSNFLYFPCSKNLFFLFLIFHSDERHRPDTSDTIRGSRPGTSTSKNSSRPSTRATVDYGFYQTIDDDTMNVPYDGEHQQHQQDEEEPPTPRLRGNNRNNENNGRNEEQRINTEIENPEEEEYQRMNEYQEQQNRGGRSPNQNHAQVGFQQDQHQQPHHQQQHQQHQQQHQHQHRHQQAFFFAPFPPARWPGWARRSSQLRPGSPWSAVCPRRTAWSKTQMWDGS